MGLGSGRLVMRRMASSIVKDTINYANESVSDPRYPLQLFQRAFTVSLEAMRVVNILPGLAIY